jgi:hypothetical protein
MARPIAETPTLRGMEALRFMERMENVKPISAHEKAQIERDYQLAKSRATFPL